MQPWKLTSRTTRQLCCRLRAFCYGSAQRRTLTAFSSLRQEVVRTTDAASSSSGGNVMKKMSMKDALTKNDFVAKEDYKDMKSQPTTAEPVKDFMNRLKKCHGLVQDRNRVVSDAERRTVLNLYEKLPQTAHHKISQKQYQQLLEVLAGFKLRYRAEKIKKVLEDMQVLEYQYGIPEFNILLSVHATDGNLDACQAVFNELKSRNLKPNSDTYRFMLAAHIRAKGTDEAKEWLLRQYDDKQLSRDSSLWHLIVMGYAQDGEFTKAIESVEQAKTLGFEMDANMFNALVSMFRLDGQFEEAYKLLQEMKQAGHVVDQRVYVGMLKSALLTDEYRDAAHKIYEMMIADGYTPNVYTYVAFMKAYSRRDLHEAVVDLFQDMIKEGIAPELESCNQLIRALCDMGRMKEAMEVFYDMVDDGIEPDVYIYSTLMDGYGKRGDLRSVEALLKKMKDEGIEPTAVTYHILMDAYARSKQMDDVSRIMTELVASGFPISVIPYNIWIHGYVRLKQLDEAEQIVKNMANDQSLPRPTTLTYNTLIMGYLSFDETEKAIELYNRMKEYSAKDPSIPPPDAVSYNLFIRYYSQAMDLDTAEKWYRELLKKKLKPDIRTYMPLLKAYADANRMSAVQELMAEAKQYNVTGYSGPHTVLIHHHAQSGDLEAAVAEFENMGRLNVRPDIRTFDVLTTAFMRQGDLDTAKEWIRMMKEDYHIPEDTRTFNILIRQSLLDSGDLEQALNYVEDMLDKGTKPDLFTHGYLLDLSDRIERSGDEELITRLRNLNELFENAQDVDVKLLKRANQLGERYLNEKKMYRYRWRWRDEYLDHNDRADDDVQAETLDSQDVIQDDELLAQSIKTSKEQTEEMAM